jgi:AcrR family transcriptional regulator
VAGREIDGVLIPLGRHGLPADVVADHQRERILAATIALVARRGYRSTSVDHIVKAAKVGYTAFYEMFDNKEQCFAAAFERIAGDARAEIAAAVSPELPWAEQICAGLAQLVDLIAADPPRARVALVEAQAAGRDAYQRYEAAIDTAVPKLAEGRALREAGAPPLTEAMEEAMIGSIAWMFQQPVAAGKAQDVPELLSAAIQVALAPYLGEAEAQRLATKFVAERA